MDRLVTRFLPGQTLQHSTSETGTTLLFGPLPLVPFVSMSPDVKRWSTLDYFALGQASPAHEAALHLVNHMHL